jgi:hypothetical protein
LSKADSAIAPPTGNNGRVKPSPQWTMAAVKSCPATAAQRINTSARRRTPLRSGNAAPGVTAGTNPSPHNLWINFSGDQPEVYAALLQLIPLTNGETYRLRFEYRTVDLPASSGLGWMVNDARTGAEISASGAWLHGPEWKHDELRFRAPVSGLARLTLLCRRLPGATRVRGTVELRSASLERVS